MGFEPVCDLGDSRIHQTPKKPVFSSWIDFRELIGTFCWLSLNRVPFLLNLKQLCCPLSARRAWENWLPLVVLKRREQGKCSIRYLVELHWNFLCWEGGKKTWWDCSMVGKDKLPTAGDYTCKWISSYLVESLSEIKRCPVRSNITSCMVLVAVTQLGSETWSQMPFCSRPGPCEKPAPSTEHRLQNAIQDHVSDSRSWTATNAVKEVNVWSYRASLNLREGLHESPSHFPERRGLCFKYQLASEIVRGLGAIQ